MSSLGRDKLTWVGTDTMEPQRGAQPHQLRFLHTAVIDQPGLHAGLSTKHGMRKYTDRARLQRSS